MAKGCVACGRELHDECPSPVEEDKCCCDNTVILQEGTGNRKPDNEITVSAGRKRAAVAYEIIPEKPCEWRWQTNCGGGKFPITGCMDGKQQARHHGPVKNTANNTPNNVHRICASCHNTWHAKNDEYYVESEYELLPHKPRPATPEEMLSKNV